MLSYVKLLKVYLQKVLNKTFHELGNFGHADCEHHISVFFHAQFGGRDLRDDEMTAETLKKQMTADEWQKVYDMSQDKNLYHNLCTSLFPTIHGINYC